MISDKVIRVFLIITIFMIIGVFTYGKFFEEKIIFTLYGNKEITIYEGDEYIEYGYLALSESGNNLNEDVKVKTNLNTDKVGEYIIDYNIKGIFRSYKQSRKIKVIENNLKNILFVLNGSSIVNLQVGSKYIDEKVTCMDKVTGEDLSKYVMIENMVNNQKEGVYEINYYLSYDGHDKVLTREVHVLNQISSHVANNSKVTNQPVSIDFNSNIYNFSKVVCPNGKIEMINNFTYTFQENGEYTFYVHDTLNNTYEYVVNIGNIDRVAPTGVCKAILSNGNTSYDVSSNDMDISKYLYHNEARYMSLRKNFNINKYQRDASVLLVDYAGNETLINCEVEQKYQEELNYLSKKEIDYQLKSNSLVVNISYTDGYYLSHIWAKDPYLQLRKEMLNEESETLKLPKTILKQAIDKYDLDRKIVFGCNASAPVLEGVYYNNVVVKSSKYNLKEPSSLLVYNGDILMNDYEEYPANTVIYYVNGSNQLSYIPIIANKTILERKEIFEEAIDSGINNTFTFNAVLVKNGEVQKVTNDYNAYRNGFCQLDENNFLSVVSDTKRWTKQEFASFMASLGCKTAVNFDGGGSNALFYKEAGNNIVTLTGNERALSSVLYFTELD